MPSYLTGLECIRCGEKYPAGMLFAGCNRHSGPESANLTPTYDYQGIQRSFTRSSLAGRPHSMWRYQEFYPAAPEEVVSLSEGFTPLLHCSRMGKRLGLKNLYVKDESRNPTWSFKDRMASSAVSMAGRFGARVIVTSSSGNAGSASAAYAARAGLECVVFTTQQFPLTMKVQMQSYGTMLAACTTLEDRWRMVEQCVDTLGWYPIAGYTIPMIGCNPYGMDGYKSIAFEIVEQLGWRAPDAVVMPVGGGDAFYATWKGFREWQRLGLIDRVPRMLAAEVFGPLANAVAKGLDHVEPVPYGPTVAVSSGTYTSTFQALKTLRESNGLARRVPEEDIVAMQKELAELEGIYAEMSSVTSLGALKSMVAEGVIDEGAVVVALLTSTGIKHPEVTATYLPQIPVIEPTLESLGVALNHTYGFSLTAAV